MVVFTAAKFWTLISIIALCLFYLVFDYTRLWLRVKKNEEQVFEFAPYEPKRYIFYGAKDSSVEYLMEKSIIAHKQGEDEIEIAYRNNRRKYILFESGDEIIFYEEGAKIKRLDKDEINNFANRVFVDYKQPEGAIRALIEDLGLRNYMFGFGICDESLKKENDNG